MARKAAHGDAGPNQLKFRNMKNNVDGQHDEQDLYDGIAEAGGKLAEKPLAFLWRVMRFSPSSMGNATSSGVSPRAVISFWESLAFAYPW